MSVYSNFEVHLLFFPVFLWKLGLWIICLGRDPKCLPYSGSRGKGFEKCCYGSRRFICDIVKADVQEWLRERDVSLYCQGLGSLMLHREKCLKRFDDWGGKQRTSVKISAYNLRVSTYLHSSKYMWGNLFSDFLLYISYINILPLNVSPINELRLRRVPHLPLPLLQSC
jgi:hypothetical protein